MAICSEPDCNDKTTGRGMCRKHYVRWYRRREGAPCKVDGCRWSVYYPSGYCATHHHHWQQSGDPLSGEKKRQINRRLDKNGYVLVRMPEHPMANSGFVLEHRAVMETHLGRQLTTEESVHHKNGRRDDNRIDNLELWARYQPAGQRVVDLVKFAHEILARYGDSSSP